VSSQALTPHNHKPSWLNDAIEHVREDGRVEGLLLFGSFARGEAGGKSDADLLVLYRDEVPDDLIDDLPPQVAITFYSPKRLRDLPRKSPLFANHLAREGKILQDRCGRLAEAVEGVEPLTDAAVNTLAAYTSHRYEAVLADPSFGPEDLLSAAELYALAKQAALLDSARRDTYEFNRHRALADLEESNPGLKTDIANISALEQIWLAKRGTAPPPSDPPSLTLDIVRSVLRVIRTASGL
jgi:polymorphic toxin system nucleotidyltransferase-like protein